MKKFLLLIVVFVVTLSISTEASAQGRYTDKPYYRYKSPGLACVASILIPGLGQVLNEQYLKGGLMFAGAVLTLSYGVNSSGDDGGVVALLYLGIYIWSIIDAPVTANRLNREHLLSLNLNGNASINLSPNLLQHKDNFTPALRLCLNF